jgi:hypothetical protein
MDKAVIERALRALAEIGAARPSVSELPREMPEPTSPAPAALCGSPDCAGCYDVADGKKIHPPKCGDDYRAWLERWKAKGRPQ